MLVDWEIEELVDAGVIENCLKENIQPTSLDVRLSSTILVDVDGGEYKEYDLSKYSVDNPFLIKPNGFILASTIEKLNLPSTISCSLKLKSSRARERLSHSLAGHIESGFNGSITLELKNYSDKNAIPIWHELRIGQLIFYKHQPVRNLYKGRYSGKDKPTVSLNICDL